MMCLSPVGHSIITLMHSTCMKLILFKIIRYGTVLKKPYNGIFLHDLFKNIFLKLSNMVH